MRNIEQKEFDEWLTHPVTIAVKEMFADRAEQLKQAWADFQFSTLGSAEAYAIQNAQEVGRCNVCQEVAALSYEDYVTEKHNEERVGAEPQGESRVD